MKTFIGVKIIDAQEMNLGEYNKYRGWTIPSDEDPDREGYLVVYPDKYESWSPKKAFKDAYRETSNGNMTFGLALEALKKGKKVARNGWNGKDMFLALQEGTQIPSSQARGGVAKEIAKTGISIIEILPHIDMRSVNGEVVVGWLASQTDMLSDDWVIVE